MRLPLGLLASLTLSGCCCGTGWLSSPPSPAQEQPNYQPHEGAGPSIYAGQVRRGRGPMTAYTLDIQGSGTPGFHRRVEVRDPEGRFRLTDLPERDVFIFSVIDEEGQGDCVSEVRPGEHNDALDIRLQVHPGRLFEGQVLDFDTGQPVVGATLTASRPSVATRRESAGPPPEFVARSQADGSFRLAGLQESVDVGVGAEGYFRSEVRMGGALFGTPHSRKVVRLLRATGDDQPLPLYFIPGLSSDVTVSAPEGGPLARAGFPLGDTVLLAIDDAEADDMGREAMEGLLRRSRGRPVKLRYRDHDGSTKELTVTLPKPAPASP